MTSKSNPCSGIARSGVRADARARVRLVYERVEAQAIALGGGAQLFVAHAVRGVHDERRPRPALDAKARRLRDRWHEVLERATVHLARAVGGLELARRRGPERRLPTRCT